VYYGPVAKEVNPGAALARKRWDKTTKEERSETMSELSRKKWDNMTDEDKKKHGARLAEARAKKRGTKTGKKGTP
jgi:hypothetical protein